VFWDLFDPGGVRPYLFSESWGAQYPQPSSTRDSTYPGTKHDFLWADGPHANVSCNAFCAGRRVNGPRCLSAQMLTNDPLAYVHGMEADHRSSVAAIRGNPWGRRVVGLAVQCGDIGTSHGPTHDSVQSADDVRIVVRHIHGRVGQRMDRVGREVCGGQGFAYAEWKQSARPDFRARIVYPRERTIQPGDREVQFVCSPKYVSDAFSVLHTTTTAQSCDERCRALGPGRYGHGFRAYQSEITAPTYRGVTPYLDRVGVGPDVSIDYYRDFNWSGDRGLDNPQARLRCVCGPGQQMRATLAVRTLK
jgi:hypothetical protein